MNKLNLTREQAQKGLEYYEAKNYTSLCADWLTQNNEIERLNKALKEMYVEIDKINIFPRSLEEESVVNHILDILVKHFPELGEK